MNKQNVRSIAVLAAGLVWCGGRSSPAQEPGSAQFPAPAPVQVEVEAKFVAFAKGDVDELMKKEPGICISAESLLDLMKAGQARILFAPRLTTRSGMNAEVKAVTECMFPTRIEAAAFPAADSNAPPCPGNSLVVPADFQIRDVGVILNLTPVVGPNGQDIELTLLPQMVFKPVWKDFGAAYIDASGGEHRLRLEQPFFDSHSIATTITVIDGATVLLGGGMNIKGDAEEVVYVFLTARIVDNRGKPIK